MVNRATKRAYFNKYKRDPDAILCPVCRHKTRHIALPNEDTLDIYCELCHNRLAQGVKPGNGAYAKEFVKGRFFKEAMNA